MDRFYNPCLVGLQQLDESRAYSLHDVPCNWDYQPQQGATSAQHANPTTATLNAIKHGTAEFA